MHRLDMKMSGSMCIIQGFGNVGSVAAEDTDRRGVRIVGVSDHSASYFGRRGLNVAPLLAHVKRTGKLEGFSNELQFDPALLLIQECDVLIPAATERGQASNGPFGSVIDGPTASRLKCRILAEGANGPTTPDADQVLDQRRSEVFVIPDILCSSGGVIVSYFEWVQGLQRLFWDRQAVLSRLFEKLDESFERVVRRAEKDEISNRTAAMALGVQAVVHAKQARGLFP